MESLTAKGSRQKYWSTAFHHMKSYISASDETRVVSLAGEDSLLLS